MVERASKRVTGRTACAAPRPDWTILAFYHFVHLSSDDMQSIEERLLELGTEAGGLIILAPDGWNGTVAGDTNFANELKKLVHATPCLTSTEFKESSSRRAPFRQFKVERRSTIIDAGVAECFPPNGKDRHLSPAEWDEMLDRRDVTVIDVRNRYEWEIGKFRNAVEAPIEKFHEFAAWLPECGVPKDKPVLMYCTGGVRCEKASVLMEQCGFREVYQLDGGILRYLAERPNRSFEGECFVFDNRVAVTQELAPSVRYRFCPHCGNAGSERISCARCGKEAIVCRLCATKAHRSTCSKDCRYHLSRAALDSADPARTGQ